VLIPFAGVFGQVLLCCAFTAQGERTSFLSTFEPAVDRITAFALFGFACTVHPVFGGYGVDGVLGRFRVIPDAFIAEYCAAFSA